MMKLLPFLFTVLLTALIDGQSMRFVYEVQYKTSTDEQAPQRKENMFLDVVDGQSKFRSENMLKRDSLIARMRQTRTFNRELLQGARTPFQFEIDKNYKTGAVLHQERIGRDLYQYKEDRPVEWLIHQETEKIGDYLAQKATASFAGREWTAWFTMDIPIPDGPYKFSNLPGLIVKMIETQGMYSFQLKESTKLPSAYNNPTVGSSIKVSREQFEAQKTRFQNDPSAFTGAMGARRQGGANPPRPNASRTGMQSVPIVNHIEVRK